MCVCMRQTRPVNFGHGLNLWWKTRPGSAGVMLTAQASELPTDAEVAGRDLRAFGDYILPAMKQQRVAMSAAIQSRANEPLR